MTHPLACFGQRLQTALTALFFSLAIPFTFCHSMGGLPHLHILRPNNNNAPLQQMLYRLTLKIFSPNSNQNVPAQVDPLQRSKLPVLFNPDIQQQQSLISQLSNSNQNIGPLPQQTFHLSHNHQNVLPGFQQRSSHDSFNQQLRPGPQQNFQAHRALSLRSALSQPSQSNQAPSNFLSQLLLPSQTLQSNQPMRPHILQTHPSQPLRPLPFQPTQENLPKGSYLTTPRLLHQTSEPNQQLKPHPQQPLQQRALPLLRPDLPSSPSQTYQQASNRPITTFQPSQQTEPTWPHLSRNQQPVPEPEPKIEADPTFSRPRGSKSSYLNPKNFQLPEMTLKEMQTTLKEIQSHIRPKNMTNPEDYTGSRVLIMLLREQCSRVATISDQSRRLFCNDFNARFRSFF